MALTNKPKRLAVMANEGKTSMVVLHGEEKATQTYKQGAPLIDDDSGRITESTSPIDASAVGKRCFGIATADATGTTDADVLMDQVGEDTVLEVTLSDSTAGTHTLAQTDKWKVYPLVKDPTFSTGFWYADTNAVSDTGGFFVREFVGAIGDVDARVRGIITTPARGTQNAGGANI